MNPIWQQQEQELKIEHICTEILIQSRNQLYLQMRFLDVALSSLRFVRDDQINPLGTDGENLYYHPQGLTGLYREGKNQVNRGYLHCLFHCLFAHIYERGKKEKVWDLACDIAAEYLLDMQNDSCIYRRKSSLRRQIYGWLEKELKVVTAQGIYRQLQARVFSTEEWENWEREFYVDDHSRWEGKQEEKPTPNPNREKWEDNREKMETEMELFSKEASEGREAMKDLLHAENRERYDYREFLRKFAVLKEVMQVDMDTFDYIYYYYGMERYGNMPLIEPLETSEVRKVEEFVIVIDTSMSCKESLIKKFLEETYSILNQTQSFHRKIQVHIIQCDDKIQSDRKITSFDEMEEYLRKFQVTGLGGTDFRPPFAYVEQLRAMGQLSHLRGLLYFTDGYGTFPAKKPSYETAFIFMKSDYQDVDVPPWAIKLIIDEEGIKGNEY